MGGESGGKHASGTRARGQLSGELLCVNVSFPQLPITSHSSLGALNWLGSMRAAPAAEKSGATAARSVQRARRARRPALPSNARTPYGQIVTRSPSRPRPAAQAQHGAAPAPPSSCSSVVQQRGRGAPAGWRQGIGGRGCQATGGAAAQAARCARKLNGARSRRVAAGATNCRPSPPARAHGSGSS